MNIYQQHPKCTTCKYLCEHSEDSDLHNGNAIVWYTCDRHEEMDIEEPVYTYCSSYIQRKGGKHDAANLR